jgi:hypothetical protein
MILHDPEMLAIPQSYAFSGLSALTGSRLN